MAVPQRVQAQADVSDQIEKQIAEELNPGQVASEGAQEAPKPEPVDTPPQEDFRAKYLTLQGMYNAEVPRLHAEVRDLKAQVTALAAAKPAPVVETPAFDPLVTSQDTEAFGSDLLDVVRRQAIDAARNEFAPEIARLRAENDALTGRVAGVTEHIVANDRNTYWQGLTTQMPDWQATNNDDGFKAWLLEIDPLSGLARQDYLENAFQKMDVSRTVALFAKYREIAGTVPPKPVEVTQLERQTAPDTSRAVAVDLSQVTEGQIITASDIEEFWKDVRRGVYKHNDAEKVRIENSIDRAVSEGRVRL